MSEFFRRAAYQRGWHAYYNGETRDKAFLQETPEYGQLWLAGWEDAAFNHQRDEFAHIPVERPAPSEGTESEVDDA